MSLGLWLNLTPPLLSASSYDRLCLMISSYPIIASLCKEGAAQLFSPLENFIAAPIGKKVVDEKAAHVSGAKFILEVKMCRRKCRLCKIINVIQDCNIRRNRYGWINKTI